MGRGVRRGPRGCRGGGGQVQKRTVGAALTLSVVRPILPFRLAVTRKRMRQDQPSSQTPSAREQQEGRSRSAKMLARSQSQAQQGRSPRQGQGCYHVVAQTAATCQELRAPCGPAPPAARGREQQRPPFASVPLRGRQRHSSYPQNTLKGVPVSAEHWQRPARDPWLRLLQ
jgi:hypothetical protein